MEQWSRTTSTPENYAPSVKVLWTNFNVRNTCQIEATFQWSIDVSVRCWKVCPSKYRIQMVQKLFVSCQCCNEIVQITVAVLFMCQNNRHGNQNNLFRIVHSAHTVCHYYFDLITVGIKINLTLLASHLGFDFQFKFLVLFRKWEYSYSLSGFLLQKVGMRRKNWVNWPFCHTVGE